MMHFEPANLVGLERKKRGFQSRKKRRAKDQHRDREKKNTENADRHFSPRQRSRDRVPSEKLQRDCLPIISATLKIKLSMTKGERISRMVQAREDGEDSATIVQNGFYRAFFRYWNDQQYYEAHDVLEQLWLKTTSEDARYFKGLIQAAGAFVHLRKQFEHPTHPKHGRRLGPAVRLFRLAMKNLFEYGPVRHAFEVTSFREMLEDYVEAILRSDFKKNPWSPQTAPKLQLKEERQSFREN